MILPILPKRYIQDIKMQAIRRVFITGTNRGLGKQFVKHVSQTHKGDIELHISSRKSVEQLKQEWQKVLPGNNIVCYKIDLGDKESIRKNVEGIQKQGLKFDWIVANAAVGSDHGLSIPSFELAESTLKTNVDATIDFLKQFLAVLGDKGRIIIVSSIMAQLDVHHDSIQNQLQKSDVTEERILQMSKEYIEAAKNKDMGVWNWSAYRTSKVLINAWNRFVLPKYLKEGQTSMAMHPGWCSTDMGGPKATSTAFQGAERIYKCLWVEDVKKDKFWNEKWVDYYTCQ